MIWGWGEPRGAVCGEVNQRWWSVVLTTTSVVYCSEFIVLSNKINKICYLPLIPGSFAVLERLRVVMLGESEQVRK